MRRPVVLRGATSAVLVWALSGCAAAAQSADGSDATSTPASAGTVMIAAAADLKFALDEVATLVEEENPSLNVEITYGSSGTFFQQIQNGAPFDLYLSADLSYPQQLVDEGAADGDDLFQYAVGRLVLWVPEGSTLDPDGGLEILVDPAVQRVSIANPEHAPYGKAAVAALENAELSARVSPKFVLGENVAQAAEFVQSGNADAGIVAKSLVLSDPLSEVGEWYELPLDTYPLLDQGGVVLGDAANPGGARAVQDAMLSEAGTEILARYGFSLPGS